MREAVETDWLSRALTAYVRWVLRHAGWIIVIGLLGSGLCAVYAAGHLGINTDTADMISPDLPWRRDYIEYRTDFAGRDRNIVIVVDANSPEQADRFSSALAKGLRAEPGLYRSVFLAGGGPFFERNGLLYLPQPQLEALADRLTLAQPLLGRLRQHFDGATLLDTLSAALDRRDSSLELPALYDELERSLAAARRGRHAPVSWERLFRAGQQQGARRYLTVLPVQNFERAQPAALAIDGIHRLAESLRGDGDADVQVRLTGTVAMEHDEFASVSRGAGIAGLASLLMVTAILYAALRSPALLGLSVLTLVAGLSATAAFAALAVGHLNLLSIAFTVLYIGLGVDFILHFCMRLRELLGDGLSLEDAITGTVRSIGSSLVLCAVTTAAGFYSFMPTPFKGVSELGLISGTGMFISLAVSTTLLPALVARCYVPGAAGAVASARREWIGARLLAPILERPRIVVAATLCVVVPALVTLPAVGFDNNPVHLRDPNSESVATLRELAAEGQGVATSLAAIAPDSQVAAEWAKALEKLPTVRNVRTIDSLVPKNQQHKRIVLDDLSLLMGPSFASLDPIQLDPSAFERSLKRLDKALRSAPALGPIAARLEETVSDLLGELQAQPARERREGLKDVDRDLIENLPGALGRLREGLNAEPFGRDSLPEDVKARWLAPDGRELLEIVPAENVNDNAAAEHFVETVRAVVPTATGLPVVHQEASRTVIHSFRLALTYALLMVLVILWAFRLGLADGLLVICPVALAGAVTAGMSVWLGIRFNFANIIALPLLLGVGVDNGIHIIHRMKGAHEEPRSVIGTSTSKAVLASGVTTIASFGNLAFSAHPGMASMGRLLTLGMTVTMAATLVLLPALLALRAKR
jgi:hopanoid biosynthesis associated RND transporter like protein HpnN